MRFYENCLTISLETGVAINDVQDFCRERAKVVPAGPDDIAIYWIRFIGEFGIKIDYRDYCAGLCH